MKSKIFLSVLLMVISASLFACFEPSASQISATNPNYTSITLHNTGVGPSGKQMQFRIKGTSSWTTTNTFTGSSIIVNVQPGTIYQYQGRLNCGFPTYWSVWSTTKEFTTLACPMPNSSQYTATNITESSTTLTNTASGTQRQVRYKTNSWWSSWIEKTISAGQNYILIPGLSPNTS